MNTAFPSATDFRRSRNWVAEFGGDLFPTHSSFEWFVRQHRQELIESGELIIRRGRAGALVGPNFGQIAVAILQRQTREQGRFA